MSLILRRNFAIRLLILVTLIGPLFVACSSGPDPGSAKPQIVVTTNVLGDLVDNIVGDAADVEVMLPIGVDPHDYQASPRQVAGMMRADLVVANGLGLEAGMDDVIAQAASAGVTIVELGSLLDPLALASAPSRLDPHVWLDPIRMAEAADVIATELSVAFPSGDWMVNAEIYASALRRADGEIRSILGAVAEEDRTMVTNHESLGYFARRYGFEVVASVIPGGSTLAEPSSAELAALVAVIEREGVRAIFAETTEPGALARAVAAEVGGQVEVVELFTESLGAPGSGAETLIEMLTTDARRIAESLS